MGGARPTPRFKPGGTRQKRQVPAASEPPVHTAPGRGQSGRGRAAPFEERREGRRRRAYGGARSALHAPGFFGAPRLREERTLRAPGGGPRPAQPAAPFPSQGKPRTGPRRDAAGGLCGRARGRLLVLSSPGWARPGLRGCGAAAGPGLGGSSCGSAGVSVAAASAGMCLCRFSLKCSASHSLTPASLQRRAAAAGALPFLVAHSLTRPPRSLLLRLRVRAPAPPPFLAGRTHHGCARGPPPPRALSDRSDLRAAGLHKPPSLPIPQDWVSGDRARSGGGLGTGEENADAARFEPGKVRDGGGG